MTEDDAQEIRYKRNHFSTRLPTGCSYTASHFWLREVASGTWRVGLTGFATRMLGEIVEFDFEVRPGDEVEVGQVIGWVEGFKAVSDVYGVVAGRFGRDNPGAREDPEQICKRPHGDGWLYEVEGAPDPGVLDVDGYISHLDRTIDKMLDEPWRSSSAAGAPPDADDASCDADR